MAEHKEGSNVQGVSGTRLFYPQTLKRHKTLLSLRQLMVQRCQDGTRFSFWSHKDWGPVSTVGADSEANYTGIYGSKASGNDLQKQVTISGCWQGESTSAMIVKFNGTQ